MAEDKLFLVGQKAFIQKEGKVLILLDPAGNLDFPGGKIQEGELDFDEALKREVKEETNLEIEIGDPFVCWSFEIGKGHKNAGKRVFLVGFICRYFSGQLSISDEHSKYLWVDRSDYKSVFEESDFFKALEEYFSRSEFF